MIYHLQTPSQVAEYLQVTEATLADMRYRSRGPRFVKVGRLVRYRREDLEAWLETSNRKPSRT